MKGFTLIEMLIVLSVVSLAGVLLSGILVNNTGFSYKQNTLVNEGLSLNDAMGEITTNIKQSAGIASSYPEGDPTPDFTASGTILILKTPSLSSTGVIENTYDYIVVKSDPVNQNILRQYFFKNPASQRDVKRDMLTTNLDTISFSYIDNNGAIVLPSAASSVVVELKVLAKAGSVTSTRTSTTVTKFRNN